MENLYSSSPAVESYGSKSLENELNGRIQTLEQQIQHLEQKLSSKESSNFQWQPDVRPQQKRIRWGKVKKFFNIVVKPILDSLPNIINAVANLINAVASKKSKGKQAFA